MSRNAIAPTADLRSQCYLRHYYTGDLEGSLLLQHGMEMEGELETIGLAGGREADGRTLVETPTVVKLRGR